MKVDEVKLSDLVDRSSAFNFMLPHKKEPIFKNNVEAISKEVASMIGELFKYLIFEKKENREIVQQFLLQSVVALFSEDFGLLPKDYFSELIRDCQNGESSYDLFGGLFKQMGNNVPAKGGRFKEIAYFNGGLFKKIESIELDSYCLDLLQKASSYNWKNVNPSIYGALFESTMNEDERHAFGAHFTSEADILKIVNPTIIQPWKKKIQDAKTLTELTGLLDEISKFKVLDPSCGCGNFLFVSYISLKELEMQIIEKIAEISCAGKILLNNKREIFACGVEVLAESFTDSDSDSVRVSISVNKRVVRSTNRTFDHFEICKTIVVSIVCI